MGKSDVCLIVLLGCWFVVLLRVRWFDRCWFCVLVLVSVCWCSCCVVCFVRAFCVCVY